MIMNIKLYVNTSENNRVDKTAYLFERASLTGSLRSGTSLENPTILLELPYEETTNEITAGGEIVQGGGEDIVLDGVTDAVLRFNYAYIPEFHRYYFVIDIGVNVSGLYAVSMRCDPLMSFKDSLLDLNALVERNEFDYEPTINDEQRPFKANVNVSYIELNGGSRKNITFDTSNTAMGEMRYALTTFVPSDKRDVIYSFVENDNPPWNDDIVSPYAGLPDISPDLAYDPTLTIPYIMRKGAIKTIEHVISLDDTTIGYIIGAVAFPFTIPYDAWTDQDYYLAIGNKWIPGNAPSRKEYLNRHGTMLPYLTLFEYDMPSANDYVSVLRTKYELYIPYYGWMPLPYQDIKGHRIALVYSVSLVDGGGNAFVYDETAEKVIQSVQVQLGTRISFNTTDYRENRNARLSLGLNTIMGAVAGGVTGGMTAGALGAVAGVSSALVKGAISSLSILDHGRVSYDKASDGLFNPQKAYLRITRALPTFDDASAGFRKYAHTYGLPLMDYRPLRFLTGFTKIENIHLDNVPCLDGERNEIEALLRAGVLL